MNLHFLQLWKLIHILLVMKDFIYNGHNIPFTYCHMLPHVPYRIPIGKLEIHVDDFNMRILPYETKQKSP